MSGDPRLSAVSGMAAFAAGDWARLDGTSRSESGKPYNPFVSHAFLSALEDSGSVGGRTGWTPAHLRLDDASGQLVGAVACYVKAHSQGEYVFDHGWADAFERAGGRYYPKLQVSVPFTPVTGPRLLVRDGNDDTRRHLVAGLESLNGQMGASSVHATFLNEADQGAFAERSWLQRTDQQFHFANRGYRDYADFLSTLASRKRKALRKEREAARAGGIDIIWLTGSDLTEAAWDDFFTFYMDTGGRKWGRPYLNRTFFSLIGERMAGDIVLMMARRAGRNVAGALNFVGSDALFGRYWGTIEEQPHLHFELCYHQAIDFAVAHGLERVEAGAQGEHKLARGYLPVTVHSAHFIAHSGLRQAVARYLEHEREQIAEIGEALTAQGPFRRDRP